MTVMESESDDLFVSHDLGAGEMIGWRRAVSKARNGVMGRCVGGVEDKA